MSDTTQIAARLGSDRVREIDETAAEDHRDRTKQLEYLTGLGLAARRRLKELERLAAEGFPGSVSGAASTAASQHLREHARLTGIQEET